MTLPTIGESPSLPALTEDEVARIAAETESALEAIIRDHRFKPNTVKAYRSALRYWDAWHHAFTGRRISILESPPSPISGIIAASFIAHHSPVEKSPGVVGMAMPDVVQERLESITSYQGRSVVGVRRVASRKLIGDKTTATENLVSLATVKSRLAALVSLHRLRGLPVDYLNDATYKAAVRSLPSAAADLAQMMLREPRRHLERHEIQRMLQACALDGVKGCRDAALIHCSFHTGGRRQSELVGMTFADLIPMDNDEGQDGGYWWSLRKVKGKQQRLVNESILRIPITGAAADALDAWLDCLRRADKPADGPVWYRVVERTKKGGEVTTSITTPMRADDVLGVVKDRAQEIGLDPALYGSHSLRSGAATDFLANGGDAKAAQAMLGHAKLETTMEYYDRRNSLLGASMALLSRHKQKP